MKKLFNLLTLLLVLALGAAEAGTVIKKSGRLLLHNFNYIQSWDFDTAGTATTTGAAAGTNTDTLVFYQDSATTAAYSTETLRMQVPNGAVLETLPDSLKYCVLAADDAADAVTLRTEYQVKLTRSADWMTVGGNGDVALAGAGVKVFTCFKREFIPGVKHRIVAHPSTTTDVAKVYRIYMASTRK